MTKINQKLKKQDVRNESCPEDRKEQRQFFFKEKPSNLTGVWNENNREIVTIKTERS